MQKHHHEQYLHKPSVNRYAKAFSFSPQVGIELFLESEKLIRHEMEHSTQDRVATSSININPNQMMNDTDINQYAHRFFVKTWKAIIRPYSSDIFSLRIDRA